MAMHRRLAFLEHRTLQRPDAYAAWLLALTPDKKQRTHFSGQKNWIFRISNYVVLLCYDDGCKVQTSFMNCSITLSEPLDAYLTVLKRRQDDEQDIN